MSSISVSSQCLILRIVVANAWCYIQSMGGQWSEQWVQFNFSDYTVFFNSFSWYKYQNLMSLTFSIVGWLIGYVVGLCVTPYTTHNFEEWTGQTCCSLLQENKLYFCSLLQENKLDLLNNVWINSYVHLLLSVLESFCILNSWQPVINVVFQWTLVAGHLRQLSEWYQKENYPNS